MLVTEIERRLHHDKAGSFIERSWSLQTPHILHIDPRHRPYQSHGSPHHLDSKWLGRLRRWQGSTAERCVISPSVLCSIGALHVTEGRSRAAVRAKRRRYQSVEKAFMSAGEVKELRAELGWKRLAYIIFRSLRQL